MKVRSFKINVADNFGSYQIQCSDSHLVKVLGYPDFCQLLCDFLPEIINEVFRVNPFLIIVLNLNNSVQ